MKMALRQFFRILLLIVLLRFCASYPSNCEIIEHIAFQNGDLSCDVEAYDIDERCKEAFIKECKLSSIKKFCKMGADAVLEAPETVCKSSNLEGFGANKYYKECCQQCKIGLSNGKKGEKVCKTIALDSDKAEYYVQEEYSRCCLSQIQKSNGCSSNCQQICGNKFSDDLKCSCQKGYILNENGFSCDDIDECALPNPCTSEEICINTLGSHECIETRQTRSERSEAATDNVSEEVDPTENTNGSSNDLDDKTAENITTAEPDVSEAETSSKDAILQSKSNQLNPQIYLYILTSFLNVFLLRNWFKSC